MEAKRVLQSTFLVAVLACSITAMQTEDCNFPTWFSEYLDDPDLRFKLFAPDSYLHNMVLEAFTVGCCDGFGGVFWAGADLLDDVNMRWDIIALAYHSMNPQENLVHEVRCPDWTQYDPCGVSGTNWPTPDHYDIDGYFEVVYQGYEEVEVGILDPENLIENHPYWVTTTWEKTTEWAGSAEFISESELTGPSTTLFSSDVWFPLGFDELGLTRYSWFDSDCFGFGCD